MVRKNDEYDWGKEEKRGFLLLGIALFLMIIVPRWNDINEWITLTLEVILFFWGMILIIKGRMRRTKKS